MFALLDLRTTSHRLAEEGSNHMGWEAPPRSLRRNSSPTNTEVAAAGSATQAQQASSPPREASSAASSTALVTGTQLADATYEDLSEAIASRLAQDRQSALLQAEQVEFAEASLAQKQRSLEEQQRRLFGAQGVGVDVVELNVGGQLISTTRTVLCSAEGSLLAGMFSGNFDSNHMRDREGRIFLDVDPRLFGKLLSHLRLRLIASPECPAPLPHVPDELRPEFEMLVKFFGLESFMYGDIAPRGNIFAQIADMTGAHQNKLSTRELIKVQLSSTGGVPMANHEEVFSQTGFHERSLENSYGASPNTITVKFLKHRVRVEGMELRAKAADVASHMSETWTFKQGNENPVQMSYAFSKKNLRTSVLPVTSALGAGFVDEVVWQFPKDFCLEHIVLFGRVLPKAAV